MATRFKEHVEHYHYGRLNNSTVTSFTSDTGPKYN